MKKISLLGWFVLYVLPTIFLSGQPANLGNGQIPDGESTRIKINAKAIAPSPQTIKAIEKENQKLRVVNDKKDDSIRILSQNTDPIIKYKYRYKTKYVPVPVTKHDTLVIFMANPPDPNDYSADTITMIKHDTVCLKDKRNLLQRIFNKPLKN